MKLSPEESKRAIAVIHRAIASVWHEKAVFVGGGIVPLLVTDPAAAACRATKDVDVVFAITTASEYSAARLTLMRAGFTDDATREKPACSLYFKDWLVDILPTQPNIVLGGGNRWFDAVIDTAEQIEIEGQALWRASAFAFIATKLEAWTDRGRSSNGAPDFYHQDMEDIIAVVDGRPELATEAMEVRGELMRFLHVMFVRLLASPDFQSAIVGHVGGCEERASMVVQRLEAMCQAWEYRID